MTVKVFWDDPQKTIIRFAFEANWVWADFIDAQREAYDLAATVQHKVGIVMVEAPTFPPEVITNQRDFSLFNNRHPNVDVFVFVVTNSLIRGIIALAMKVNRIAAATVIVVSTLEQARTAVNERLQKAG